MTTKIRVAVVGAGLGGVAAAVKLKEAGIDDFMVFDRNQKVGGVWHENKYPGCCCDTPVALYEFSFAPNPGWTHLFPRAAEVQAYAESIVENHQLTSHMKLGDGMASAVWNETSNTWLLKTENGTRI